MVFHLATILTQRRLHLLQVGARRNHEVLELSDLILPVNGHIRFLRQFAVLRSPLLVKLHAQLLHLLRLNLSVSVLIPMGVLARAENVLSDLHHRWHGAELRLVVVDARLHEVVRLVIINVGRLKPVPLKSRISDLFLHVCVRVHLRTGVLETLSCLILGAVFLLLAGPQLCDELADAIEDALALLSSLRRRLLTGVLLLHQGLDTGGNRHGGPLLILVIDLLIVVGLFIREGTVQLLRALKVLQRLRELVQQLYSIVVFPGLVVRPAELAEGAGMLGLRLHLNVRALLHQLVLFDLRHLPDLDRVLDHHATLAASLVGMVQHLDSLDHFRVDSGSHCRRHLLLLLVPEDDGLLTVIGVAVGRVTAPPPLFARLLPILLGLLLDVLGAKQVCVLLVLHGHDRLLRVVVLHAQGRPVAAVLRVADLTRVEGHLAAAALGPTPSGTCDDLHAAHVTPREGHSAHVGHFVVLASEQFLLGLQRVHVGRRLVVTRTQVELCVLAVLLVLQHLGRELVGVDVHVLEGLWLVPLELVAVVRLHLAEGVGHVVSRAVHVQDLGVVHGRQLTDHISLEYVLELFLSGVGVSASIQFKLEK